MELPVEIVPASVLRQLIARTFLADETPSEQSPVPLAPTCEDRLGSIVLRPHQISAIRRLRSALDQFGGALLADEVGMGKTFVALTIATRFKRPLVVGPAVLRDMWSHQARLAGIEIPFVSFESLSRGRHVAGSFDLVVVDEAHHLRNPATRRYRELSRVAMHSRVLLVSATPIHNTRNDLTALLAIFLGSQAQSLSSTEFARCVVRRGVESAGLTDGIPQAAELVWKEVRDDARVPDLLLSLPPPLPVRDGGVGGVLVARSLIRQWCSSDASLEGALRRRLARSIALILALESGHYPSREELSAWTVGDDSVQLAFPSFVAAPESNAADLLCTINEHRKALRDVLHSVDPDHPRDRMRAEFLKDIRCVHPGIPIIAFSQYSDTVNALFRELRKEPRVAVLTARGARVAGGALTRREALARFAPRASGVSPPRDIERIDVLLATDLLSEGVNLQDAGVVVHLDLPWTAARLEQRMGRVARLGSTYRRVYAYGIRPPAAAEILIRLEATIAAKVIEAEVTAAPTAVDERIRTCLRPWFASDSVPPDKRLSPTSEGTRVAVVESRKTGFLAICARGAQRSLLASNGHRITTDPSEILDCLKNADGRDISPQLDEIAAALKVLKQHMRKEQTVAPASSQSANAARARRAALRRVSGIVQRARPHERSRLLELAMNARLAILGRLGVAAESDLMRRAKADLEDEQWLRAVGDSAFVPSQETSAIDINGGAVGADQVTALLMFEQSTLSKPVNESSSMR